MEEIRARYSVDEGVPATPDQIEREFPSWLARVREPLVLVIDAVDQLDDRSIQLSWLPARFPAASATANRINWLIQPTPSRAGSPALITGGRLSSRGLKGRASQAR